MAEDRRSNKAKIEIGITIKMIKRKRVREAAKRERKLALQLKKKVPESHIQKV